MTTEKETKKETKTLSESDKIWNEIKDLPLDLYALSGQTVSDHTTKMKLPGEKLYLTPASSAVLPALESVLQSKFDVEMADKYIVVQRKQSEAASLTLEPDLK